MAKHNPAAGAHNVLPEAKFRDTQSWERLGSVDLSGLGTRNPTDGGHQDNSPRNVSESRILAPLAETPTWEQEPWPDRGIWQGDRGNRFKGFDPDFEPTQKTDQEREQAAFQKLFTVPTRRTRRG